MEQATSSDSIKVKERMRASCDSKRNECALGQLRPTFN